VESWAVKIAGKLKSNYFLNISKIQIILEFESQYLMLEEKSVVLSKCPQASTISK